MKQVLQNTKNGDLKVVDVPPPVVKNGGILVKNLYSLISVGTEKMIIELSRKGLLAKAKERPEQFKEVVNKIKAEGLFSTYRKVMERLDDPIALGYSSVGQVIEVGIGCTEFQAGDLVACAGAGYACHAEVVFVPQNLAIKLDAPGKVRQCAYVALGSAAMHGIRLAEVALGESVGVIGLGLMGQITVQLLKAAGCRVIGMDIDDKRIKIAECQGMDIGINPSSSDLKALIDNYTNGYGVDKVIITAASKDNGPVDLAGEIARDRAIISIVGTVGMEVPLKSYYEKELDIRISRSYGPGRYDTGYEEHGQDYPIGYVRWTEKRNMQEFIRLVCEGQINMDKLTTHVHDIVDAESVYQMVIDNPKKEEFLGVLLHYKDNANRQEFESKMELKSAVANEVQKEAGQIRLGMIGAGNFAKGIIVPKFYKMGSIKMEGIASAKGINAKVVGKKYLFAYATSNFVDIIKDVKVNFVVVATTHDLHAQVVCEALTAGKHVYVEKPLAINFEGLTQVKMAKETSSAQLIVGYNRRYAPMVIKLRECMPQSFPMLISYRVNAGFISKDHWINDPNIGGGRMIGEVCHFVDLMTYITGSKPVSIQAQSVDAGNDKYINQDNFSLTIKYENGSMGNIIYTSLGDKGYPKERIEVYSNGSIFVIDDFNKATFTQKGRTQRISIGSQDKGFDNFYRLMINALHTGKALMDFDQLYQTSLITFKALESMRDNKSLQI